MKTQNRKISKHVSMAVAMLIAVFGALNAGAVGNANLATDEARVIYQSQSVNHSIYGYPSSLKGESSSTAELIYVNQAYGPAIHSYQHVGGEITVPWNVEYVDTAYGQAIYSYERRGGEGLVKLLPMVTY